MNSRRPKGKRARDNAVCLREPANDGTGTYVYYFIAELSIDAEVLYNVQTNVEFRKEWDEYVRSTGAKTSRRGSFESRSE